MFKNFLRKASVPAVMLAGALSSLAADATANAAVTSAATEMKDQLTADITALLPIIGAAMVVFLGPWLIKKLIAWIKSR